MANAVRSFAGSYTDLQEPACRQKGQANQGRRTPGVNALGSTRLGVSREATG